MSPEARGVDVDMFMRERVTTDLLQMIETVYQCMLKLGRRLVGDELAISFSLPTKTDKPPKGGCY